MNIEALLAQGHKATLKEAIAERAIRAKYNLTQIENHLAFPHVIEQNLEALKTILEEVQALTLYLNKLK